MLQHCRKLRPRDWSQFAVQCVVLAVRFLRFLNTFILIVDCSAHFNFMHALCPSAACAASYTCKVLPRPQMQGQGACSPSQVLPCKNIVTCHACTPCVVSSIAPNTAGRATAAPSRRVSNSMVGPGLR